MFTDSKYLGRGFLKVLMLSFQSDYSYFTEDILFKPGVLGVGRLGLRQGLAFHLNEWGVYFARHFSGDD